MNDTKFAMIGELAEKRSEKQSGPTETEDRNRSLREANALLTVSSPLISKRKGSPMSGACSVSRRLALSLAEAQNL